MARYYYEKAIDWWEGDPHFPPEEVEETRALREEAGLLLSGEDKTSTGKSER
jgi:hypothetical protein